MFPNSSWRFGVHYYNLQSILPSLLPLLGFCAPASLITCWPSLAAEHTNTHTHTLAHSHTHTHTLSLSLNHSHSRSLSLHSSPQRSRSRFVLSPFSTCARAVIRAWLIKGCLHTSAFTAPPTATCAFTAPPHPWATAFSLSLCLSVCYRTASSMNYMVPFTPEKPVQRTNKVHEQSPPTPACATTLPPHTRHAPSNPLSAIHLAHLGGSLLRLRLRLRLLDV